MQDQKSSNVILQSQQDLENVQAVKSHQKNCNPNEAEHLPLTNFDELFIQQDPIMGDELLGK